MIWEELRRNDGLQIRCVLSTLSPAWSAAAVQLGGTTGLLGTKICLQLFCSPATSSVKTIKITFAVLQALVLPPLPFPLVHMVSKERRPLQPWLFAHSYQRLGVCAAERKVRKHLQSQSSFVSYLSELSADMNSSPVKTGIPLTYMVWPKNLWYNFPLPFLCAAHVAITSSCRICSLRKRASAAVK